MHTYGLYHRKYGMPETESASGDKVQLGRKRHCILSVSGCNSAHLDNAPKLAISLECRAPEAAYLTVSEAAAKLGRDRSWVYRLCRRGELGVVRRWGALRVPTSEVLGLLMRPAGSEG